MNPLALLFSLLFLVCVGCSRECLWIQTQSIHRTHLASVKVGTPDPQKSCPSVGQRAVIHWELPRQCPLEGCWLVVAFRYGSHEEQVMRLPLRSRRGCQVYELLDEEYFHRCGMQAIKAEICCDGEVAYQWHHQVWVDLLEISIEDEPSGLNGYHTPSSI